MESFILRHIRVVFFYWKFLKKYKSIKAKLSYFTFLKTKISATSWTSQQKIREKVRQDVVTVHRWKGVMVGVSVTSTRKTVASMVLYLPCLSLGLSVTVRLSQFELRWCVCISVCLRDYFQGDVIHLSLCHLSNCHKKLCLTVCQQHLIHVNSFLFMQEKNCQIKLEIGRYGISC